MPLILVPLALLAIIMVLIALMPVTLVLRYRGATARRLARGWVVTLNLVGVAVSIGIFLATAAVTSLWVPRALTYSLAGLAIGGLLGLLGVSWSRWERAPQSLHYTPNRWLVLAIMLVVSSRLLYGCWRAWHVWQSGPGDTSWLAAAGVAGSMAAGAVVLGYYLTYWAGVRGRIKRHAA